MGLEQILKYVLLFCTCHAWFSFYCFLNAYVRTLKLCIDVFNGGKNLIMKILFVLFMCCCGCQIVQCIFCIFSCVYIFTGQCQAFVNSGDLYDGYHKLVYKPDFPIESSVKGMLKKVF